MNINLLIREMCVWVQEINTEVDEKVKLGEVGLIFRTTRSCLWGRREEVMVGRWPKWLCKSDVAPSGSNESQNHVVYSS
jgi:hypothetical protein